jgi:hypothetical protein
MPAGWNRGFGCGNHALMTDRKDPPPAAIAEAARHPGGWLYEIGGGLDPDAAAPPEAVVGAWRVSDEGKIVGAFIPNPDYDPVRWPAKPS